MLRLSAMANARCELRNHMASAAVVATIIVSAPMPKNRRPAAIVKNSPRLAVRAAPRRQIPVVQRGTRPGP